jgi:predicted metal-dependent phosphoesterase TrpH
MFIDLHLHESAYSPDSQMTLDELVQAAREKGLGAVCITDHDSMGLAEYVKEYSREHQYPVLVGAEFFSLWGDIKEEIIGGICLINTNMEQVLTLSVKVRIQQSFSRLLPLHLA